MKLTEYYEMLENHDWFYMMSDDPKVYRRGVTAESTVKRYATCSPKHWELYRAYRDYKFSNGEKPEKPND